MSNIILHQPSLHVYQSYIQDLITYAHGFTSLDPSVIMAGPRERSRHRGMERQEQHELQNRQSFHHSTTTLEGLNAHEEDHLDDHKLGLPQNLRARRSDRTSSRMRKERLVKARILMILTASVILILFVYAFCVFRHPSRSAEPSNYEPEWTHTTAITRPGSTVYHTVHYQQFYHARPIHDQAAMAVSSDLEAIDRTTSQDLSHPPVMTTTVTPVPGLYFIPMPITDGGWPQAQLYSQPSSHSASNTEKSRVLQTNPDWKASETDSDGLIEFPGIGSSETRVVGRADAGTTSVGRWGMVTLYRLRRRSGQSVSYYKGWCVKNACSPQKRLNSMCNTNKTITDPFRKQECKWCWPEDQKMVAEIDSHCLEVSKRAFDALIIICGIFLFFMLVITMLLAIRSLRRSQKVKSGRLPDKLATNISPIQEKANNFIPSSWFSQVTSKFGRSSKAGPARTRADYQGNAGFQKRSVGEANGPVPWYRVIFARLADGSKIGPENPALGRSNLEKQKMKLVDHKLAKRQGESLESVPVLPPAPPTISSQVFSDIENMGQGSLSPDSGVNSSQRDPQGYRPDLRSNTEPLAQAARGEILG